MDVLNRKIIEYVRLHKFIYDPTDPHYGELRRKNTAWRDLARKLDIPEYECKKSWHLLREGYRRVLKKRIAFEKDTTYRKDKEIKKWIYEDDLSFLFPYMKNGGLLELNNHIQNNNNKVINPEKQKETPQKVTPQTRLLLKRSRTNDGIARPSCSHETTSTKLVKYILDKANNRSDVHQFFDSMAATVLSFTPRDRAVAKAKVFEVISKMEIEILDREQNACQSIHCPVTSDMEVSESRRELNVSLPPEALTAGLSESYKSDDDEEVVVMNVKVEPEQLLEMNIKQEPNNM